MPKIIERDYMMDKGKSLVIGALLVTLSNGCIMSDVHHARMLCGGCTPQPYPLIRYWAEYTEEDFSQNVLAVPFIGFPGVVPIGYCSDLLIDTFFFPIDFLLSCVISDFTVATQFSEGGYAEVEVKTTAAQLHRDIRQCQCCIPIRVEVKQGTLTVLIDDEAQLIITPTYIYERTRNVLGEYAWQRIDIEANCFVLYCAPSVTEPVPLIGVLSPQESFVAGHRFNLYECEMDISVWKEYTCVRPSNELSLIRSADFQGICNYKEMPIDRLTFVRP